MGAPDGAESSRGRAGGSRSPGSGPSGRPGEDREDRGRGEARQRDERGDAAQDGGQEGSSWAIRARRPVRLDPAHRGEHPEDEPQDKRAGGEGRDLRRVANVDRVDQVEERSEDRDREEGPSRRDPDSPNVKAGATT